MEGASRVGPAALINEVKRCIERTVHFVIRDPYDLPGSRTQECFTPGIVPALRIAAMRGAVNFDDKARANAGKIGDVRADGMLPAESHSAECPAAAATIELFRRGSAFDEVSARE